MREQPRSNPDAATIAAYYFPNYHVDPRNEKWHGQGWTEWELTKQATPRFENHVQPRIPLLGYEDEADPAVMKNKMEMAIRHGVNAFLFDWYWYDDHPYLERPLETAFIPNTAAHDMKFAVMWANHHWTNIHPWKSGTVPTFLVDVAGVGPLAADFGLGFVDEELAPACLRQGGVTHTEGDGLLGTETRVVEGGEEGPVEASATRTPAYPVQHLGNQVTVQQASLVDGRVRRQVIT
ncbi:glycoside hydrolase family 99-like domain-containing protein [Streptomyces sp. 110]|uniref:Glycoside hydrolase family 99-like domain-containing protein n=1 Tax=Streptomyces endocoffeicus TaxID=2898945 RepID=A0ABS1Q682_9ACTN|nr:glycoside hydrolase family 99-like domain-containing protein [Streptomyces endocoffeicus]MBL1120169.1 glycoside hydrolase family 99-like domain-containing protein [Streptomyces endocoffeicus]